MIGSLIFAAFSIVFCIMFCMFRSEKATVLSLLKTISSICFVLCAVFAINYMGIGNGGLLILVGLIFGLIGDIVLDLKIMYPKQGDSYFIFGTSAFAIGHIFYAFATVLYNLSVLQSHLWWNLLASILIAIAATVGIVFASKKMGLNFGKMFYPVVGYSVILNFMFAFSVSIAIFNPIFWIFAAGMFLFLASDLVLSMQYFGGRKEKSLIWINHILYYLAQVAIAVSLLFVLF